MGRSSSLQQRSNSRSTEEIGYSQMHRRNSCEHKPKTQVMQKSYSYQYLSHNEDQNRPVVKHEHKNSSDYAMF